MISQRSYRIVVSSMLALIIMGLAGFFSDSVHASYAFFSCAIICFVFLLFTFRCANCATRPITWIFFVWLLFIDLEQFIANVILLRQCPKCRNNLFKKQMGT